jgi:transcriptional regulator with XRE-family HTH domain
MFVHNMKGSRERRRGQLTGVKPPNERRGQPKFEGQVTFTSLLGSRVRRLREDRHWLQKDLATRARCSRKTVSNLECGRLNPTLETLLRVMGAFGLSSLEQLASGLDSWGSAELLEKIRAPVTASSVSLPAARAAERRSKTATKDPGPG